MAIRLMSRSEIPPIHVTARGQTDKDLVAGSSVRKRSNGRQILVIERQLLYGQG
jgi:hypothetical protein